MKYVYEPDVQLPEGVNIDKINLLAFYKFIHDRQLVWHNRFIKQLPSELWTTDAIFKRTKYTNVYRELDRGTIYLIDHIKNEKKNIEIFWAICVYRLLNKIETFDKIGIISYKDFGKKKKRDEWFASIRQLLADGVKVWTSAHITLQSNLKQDRISNYEVILDKLYEQFDQLTKDVFNIDYQLGAFKLILKGYGFGPFISFEVASDLAVLPMTKFDNNTWANAGPGCIPGIKIIFPKYNSQDEYMNAMVLLRDYQENAFDSLGLDFKAIWYNEEYLTLRNIEHSLCEFRKYWCEQRGVGRPRPLFTPVSESNLYIKRKLL